MLGCLGGEHALRHCAFTLVYSQSPKGCVSPSTEHRPELHNSSDGVECAAHHSGSRGVVGIMLVTMSQLSLQLLISITAEVAEDDPLLYK